MNPGPATRDRDLDLLVAGDVHPDVFVDDDVAHTAA